MMDTVNACGAAAVGLPVNNGLQMRIVRSAVVWPHTKTWFVKYTGYHYARAWYCENGGWRYDDGYSLPYLDQVLLKPVSRRHVIGAIGKYFYDVTDRCRRD